MNSRSGLVRMLIGAVALGVSSAQAADLVIKTRQTHTAAGATVDGAMLLIRDGRIVSIGPDLPIPSGAKVLDYSAAVVTPGLIDACCVLASGEEAAPVRPRRRRAPETKSPVASSLWVEIADTVAHADGQSSGEGEFAFPDFYAGERVSHDHHTGCACAGPHTREDALALAEAASGIGLRTTWAEHSAEVIPHRRVLDSVDLFSPDMQRLLREGVTTVFASPDSGSVIGSRGAILKTGGPLSGRVVRDADAVKASMGVDPSIRGRPNIGPFGGISDIYTRRPTTRMGVDWVFRKAFYDAQLPDGTPLRGADAPPIEALDSLRELLRGDIPLRIQARYQHDIYNAVRLADEFGLRFVLEEATEAYKAIELLRARQIPVIYGPIFNAPTGFRAATREADDARLSTPKLLHENGILFALTAQEMRDEEGLGRQAMMARASGLPADAALRAVTETPAALLGLSDRVGTLKPGADADIVVWSGEPFAATSRVTQVLIGGVVVFDAR